MVVANPRIYSQDQDDDDDDDDGRRREGRKGKEGKKSDIITELLTLLLPYLS
jgi:Zn-finger nucleic acid-binding protein